MIKLLVYRSAEQEKEDVNHRGEYKEYEIPYEDRMTVLSALNYIKQNLDSSLAYYKSCRIGKCTGCLVEVNGKNKLACTTLLENTMKIGPVRKYKIIRDLIVDFSYESI
mgnify:CR=1 FL=1